MTHTMTPTLTRTTEEVYNSHREAVETMDLEKLMADYAEDAVLVTLDGSFVGREAIFEGFFQPYLAQFPDIKFNFERTAFEDDVCLLQWSAEASAASVPKGTAVFAIRDGLIQRQGEWFELVLKEA